MPSGLSSGKRPEPEGFRQLGVESLGGTATGSVSGNTDVVVVGEDPGAKAEDARRRGIRMVSESSFRTMLRRAGART